MGTFKLKDLIIADKPDYVVVNKPPGLLSIPDREGRDPSLKLLLQETYGDILTVHRLDRDTSGVILFARTPDAHRALSRLFEERRTEKIYLGIVIGSWNGKGVINVPIAEKPGHPGTMMVHQNGKEAVTEYEVLENFELYSLVRFHIHTGRTHQIRVHARHMGHPIACDLVYGDGQPIMVSAIRRRYHLSADQEAEQPILDRLALHAASLRFPYPENEEQFAEAPLLKDMKATLQQLRKRAGR